MTMIANNRNHRLGSGDGEGRVSFKGHIDSMRMFRGSHVGCPTDLAPKGASFAEHTSLMRTFQKSHLSILVAISTGDEQLALLKSVQFLPATYAIEGVGGTRRFIASGEKTAIIPLLKVTLHSLSFN